MTNREKLEMMSNGELGQWICGLIDARGCREVCPAEKLCRLGYNGMADWLKQEAEKDHDTRGL